MSDLANHPVAELLKLHGNVMNELRHRGVTRSANNPSGDYGELLFSRAFGWDLEANSAAGYDAKDGQGARYQIKCRRLTAANPSRQLSFIRNLPNQPFDVLAGVLLEPSYRVKRAALIPVGIVQQHATYVASVNAWRFLLRDRVWDLPGVEDVTERLRATEISL
ncbi:MAG: hypothetical protein J7521_07145 [Caulobacter sp.]|nr:hypothetical protein [Caulobacter sp.]